ncbi:MAG: divalent-cation tolerance protein CutA [Pyrinomonadaceae bacterium]|jgi:periplasmic divalent cation tolerance protein|nr:divalent-cation tolerance protein CutA [Pyrinomonadaceae bacterium]
MLVIFTTTPSHLDATILAEKLVSEKLAACVQVLPKMTSFYFWEGKVQHDDEFLLLIKTSDEKYSQIEEFIKANHSYTTPEIVAVKAEKVEANYLNWLNDYLQ